MNVFHTLNVGSLQIFWKLPLTEGRGISRTSARSDIEILMTKVNGWNPSTLVTKSSTSYFSVVLDMPLEVDTLKTIR